MPKIHISKDGVARTCSAQSPERCRAKKAEGLDTHYDSVEQAQEAYEKYMESNGSNFQLSKNTNSKTNRSGSDNVREGSGLKSNGNSIRFMKNPTEAEIDKTTADLHKRFQQYSRVKVDDRLAHATGVPTIQKDNDSYSFGKYRMKTFVPFYNSSNLKDVVQRAGEDEGFDPEEYDPRDWDS